MITVKRLHIEPRISPVLRADRQDPVLKTRLGTADPYWWILTGGIHVPGFEPTVRDPEVLGLDRAVHDDSLSSGWPLGPNSRAAEGR
jgi:hypothetical protein